MHCFVNFFPVSAEQKLLKLVKIWQSCSQMYTATLYEPRRNCTFWFFQVRCAHKLGDVINFIIVTSRLKWYKNIKIGLRLAKVIVKNKMSRFYGSLCNDIYLYSHNMQRTKRRKTRPCKLIISLLITYGFVTFCPIWGEIWLLFVRCVNVPVRGCRCASRQAHVLSPTQICEQINKLLLSNIVMTGCDTCFAGSPYIHVGLSTAVGRWTRRDRPAPT